MNIKIGIIENEKKYSQNLCDLLETWSSAQSCTLDIQLFSTGKEILQTNDLDHNILFIDIQLDDTNGVDIAKTLRKKNCSSEIVFLTAYKEYVFEGYNVHALNYILKPITYEKLKACMDAVLESIQSENYILRNRDIIIKIPYKEIMYILSSRHHMDIVTKEKTYTHLISIKKLLNCLPAQFVQCHRTAIINVNFIQKLEGREVLMSDFTTLPISNTYLKDVRKKLENLVL